jgi:perosamine synthetase
MRKVGVGDFIATTDMIEAVVNVLQSGRLSYGPYCKRFESEFSWHHDCDFGVLSNSGTSSLHVALQTLKEIHDWPDGSEALIPASTFVATLNIVLHNRMIPVLVDIEPCYFALNPELIADYITPKTRVIIPVHPFGQPANMKLITDLVRPLDIKVIEDSCECVGVGHQGRMVGSWSDISCFSFYIAHIISTGVGGMALTSNPDYAAYMRSLVNHGRDNIYISMDDSTDRLTEVIGRRFKFPRIGHSFRITELEAAIGLEQLDRLREIWEQRNLIATALQDRMRESCPWLGTLSARPHTDRAWMMFPILIRDVSVRKRDLTQYLEAHGIETRDALPLTNQPAYPWISEFDYPVAKILNDYGFYIGCHQYMTLEDVDYIMEVLGEF